jgi:hypothetical protein
LLAQTLAEGVGLLPVIARRKHVELRDSHPLRLETRADRARHAKTLHEEACADERNNGQCHFRDYENAAQPL